MDLAKIFFLLAIHIYLLEDIDFLLEFKKKDIEKLVAIVREKVKR
jgi:hypothetical protein